MVWARHAVSGPIFRRPLHDECPSHHLWPHSDTVITAPTGVAGPFAFTDGSLAARGQWSKHASQVQSTVSCWYQEVRKKWPKWGGKVGSKICL